MDFHIGIEIEILQNNRDIEWVKEKTIEYSEEKEKEKELYKKVI